MLRKSHGRVVLAVGPGRRNDAGERIPMDAACICVLYSAWHPERPAAGEDYLILGSRLFSQSEGKFSLILRHCAMVWWAEFLLLKN